MSLTANSNKGYKTELLNIRGDPKNTYHLTRILSFYYFTLDD